MMFTSGYDWLDWTYAATVIIGITLYVFKPLKKKTHEEVKASKKIVKYYSKYGRRGYVTKGQKDFEVKYWIFGFLITFFLIVLPWILQELGYLSV